MCSSDLYPAKDESLLKEIPPSMKVFRSKIFEPYSLYRKLTGKPANAAVDVENIPQTGKRRSIPEMIASFIRSTFFIPDARIGWYPYAVKEGLRIIEEERIDALYSSSPPYTTAMIAKALHRKSGVKWIAGFRDPWTGFLSTPDRWFLPHRIDQQFERDVFEQANYIEAAWKGIILDVCKKFPNIGVRKFFHLPNGFDSDDYPQTKENRTYRFTITYTGSMYGVRNPRTLLQAFYELVVEGKIQKEKIQIKFIGRFGLEVREMIAKSIVSSSIEVKPYIPHTESIVELMKSDVLLLVVDETVDSNEIVPGKVFEYIGAKKPILALAPKGAIEDIIKETRSGIVVANQDVQGIKEAIMILYKKYCDNEQLTTPDNEVIRKYERKEITRQLSELLNSL